MANDCLITKLKGTVQNENLPILGTLTVKTLAGGNCIIKPLDGKTITVTKRNDDTQTIVTQNTTMDMAANSIYDISSVYDIERIGFSRMYIEKLIGINGLINNEFFYPYEDFDINDFSDLPVGNIRFVSFDFVNSVSSKGEILSFLRTMTKTKDILLLNTYPRYTTQEIGSLGWFKYENGFINIINQSVTGTIEELVAAERKQGVSSASIDLEQNVRTNNITFNGESIPSVSGYNHLSWAPNASVSSNTDVTLDEVTITIDSNGEKVE